MASSTPDATFTYYADPTVLDLSKCPDDGVVIGVGSFAAEEHRPVVTLGFGEGHVHLLPSEARLIGEALVNAIDSDDEGHPLSTSPRTGQTFPVSSPLDTLKHTVLGVISLLDVALDGLDGQNEEVAELLDAIQVEVLTGLREHIPGVNPHGNGEGPFPHMGIAFLDAEPRGHFPTAEVAHAALTYDNGSPIRLLIKDGGVTHEVMPRVHTRSTSVETDASDAV